MIINNLLMNTKFNIYPGLFYNLNAYTLMSIAVIKYCKAVVFSASRHHETPSGNNCIFNPSLDKICWRLGKAKLQLRLLALWIWACKWINKLKIRIFSWILNSQRLKTCKSQYSKKKLVHFKWIAVPRWYIWQPTQALVLYIFFFLFKFRFLFFCFAYLHTQMCTFSLFWVCLYVFLSLSLSLSCAHSQTCEVVSWIHIILLLREFKIMAHPLVVLPNYLAMLFSHQMNFWSLACYLNSKLHLHVAMFCLYVSTRWKLTRVIGHSGNLSTGSFKGF